MTTADCPNGSMGRQGFQVTRTSSALVGTFPAPQKSGFIARGTSASFPGYQLRFSAHTFSGQSRALSPSLRYVIVAVHGVVKTFLSSIVNSSCKYFPAAFGTGGPGALLCCFASRSNPSFAAS